MGDTIREPSFFRERALSSLRELVRAFDVADRRLSGALLRGYEGAARQEIYDGLVTVILRIVVLLHAEARDLLPGESEGATARPITELFDELSDEQQRSGDSAMEQARGAWPRLLALFRRVHGQLDGEATARREGRRGGLFDPDAHTFLEGRARDGSPRSADAEGPPPIDDGAIRRVLSLLVADGSTRLCYEDLGVEHIGTAHEGLMGYSLEIAEGRSIALLPDHAVLDLDALVHLTGDERIARVSRVIDLHHGGRLVTSIAEATSVAELQQAFARRASTEVLGLLPPGALYLQPGEARRRAGSYYTPPLLTRAVVERTLAPLLRPGGRDASPEEIVSLAVCDPAMGSGAFLVEACRRLAAALEEASARAGVEVPGSPSDPADVRALRLVAERCLYGVDRNPLAVDLARLSLAITARSRGLSTSFFDGRLVCGDSLLGARLEDLQRFPLEAFQRSGASPQESALLRARYRERREQVERMGGGDAEGAPSLEDDHARAKALSAWMALWFWPASDEGDDAPSPATLGAFLRGAASLDASDPRANAALRIAEQRRFFHFEAALPAVFGRDPPGFDAIVGNPPWVAYAGRAAQPLEPSVFNVYLRRSPAFRGYRSLHGLFIHRCASLLRAGGRLGLVLPTSVSDLDGYEAARRAHDELCAVDDELPDFGSAAFEGVYQPAMALLSTRRSARHAPVARAKSPAWPLARSDLDVAARRLFSRLSALPPLPASLFGERGFQTNTEDGVHLRPIESEVREGLIPIREGTDIGEFIARPPRRALDVSAIRGRFREESAWRRVRLFIRQTARYPIAALADGVPFRNSILAGFEGEGWSDLALLCYLNSSPIRWFHYIRNRDARQGMPQVKIAHLRALPSPGPNAPVLIEKLGALGEPRLRANAGISEEDRLFIEAVVAEALEMTDEERERVAAWAAANPIPKPAGPAASEGALPPTLPLVATPEEPEAPR